MPLCHYIFFFSLGRQASRQKRTDWKNGSILIHFAQAGHFDEKFQIFFWPHVVPKWNPNIARGSLSWFRSIRVRGLAVMGVWKCVNNSIYESPVTTQAKTKIDHKLEPMVRLQMTIQIIRRLTSLWLLTKIFWPKFFDRNVYWKLPPLSIVYFHIYWDYLVHFFSFKNSFPKNFLNNTISFSIIDGLDSAAQFLAASCHQSPDIDLRLKLDKRQSEEGFS